MIVFWWLVNIETIEWKSALHCKLMGRKTVLIALAKACVLFWRFVVSKKKSSTNNKDQQNHLNSQFSGQSRHSGSPSLPPPSPSQSSALPNRFRYKAKLDERNTLVQPSPVPTSFWDGVPGLIIAVTAVKNILCGGREEGVCFWLRGNWNVPTVHKGNTPGRGVALLVGGWVEGGLIWYQKTNSLLPPAT